MVNYAPYKLYFDRLGANKDNIVLIHNFINSEDVKLIQDYLFPKENDDNFMGGKDIRLDQVKQENPKVALLLEKYENKVFDEAHKLFTLKYGIPIIRKPNNDTHFVKWTIGMNSKLHCDCEKPDGSPAEAAEFYKYNVSVLMYPNNDYTGGEITFPEYNITIKPQAGDMILFPGNGAYKHTVQQVTSGTRYTMPSWYSFDVNEPALKDNSKQWTYQDSVQLWPDNPEIDPVGDDARQRYLNEQTSMER